MTGKFKLRYVIICLLLLALFTCATAFSVSYAKWNSSSDNVSASSVTGSWAKNITQMKDDEILEDIKKQAGAENTDYGGAIVSNGKIIGIKWENTPGSDGYTINLDLKMGDTFVVVIFDRVWERDKSYGFLQGSCVLNNNASGSISVSGKVFKAESDCSIVLDVREGGYRSRDDIVTISYN